MEKIGPTHKIPNKNFKNDPYDIPSTHKKIWPKMGQDDREKVQK